MIAMADTIRDLGRVPSGELYARVMGHMNMATYNRVIGSLKAAGLVEEKSFELIWTGPAKEAGK
jgi:hypothetical protein